MSRASRFEYSLQPVLLTRQWELDALLAELGEINAKVQATQAAIATLSAEIAAVAQAWQEECATTEHLQPDRLALVNRYLRQLADQRTGLQQRLRQEQDQRDQMMDKVAQAKRALEAAEEHRDNEKLKFQREQNSLDMKAMDDQWSGAQSIKEVKHD